MTYTYAELLARYTDLLIENEKLKKDIEMLRALGISTKKSEVSKNAKR